MPMPIDFAEIDPTRLAAILYRPQDDVDTILAGFAGDLLRTGARLGGIAQRNMKASSGCQADMQAIDLLTGRSISICQPLGRSAAACRLDTGGLAEAAMAITRAIGEDVDLIVVNKFSKQEAAGRGLRPELAEAIVAGIPVLTAVPWKEFCGDIGTMLLCERPVLDGWWRDLSRRTQYKRAA